MTTGSGTDTADQYPLPFSRFAAVANRLSPTMQGRHDFSLIWRGLHPAWGGGGKWSCQRSPHQTPLLPMGLVRQFPVFKEHIVCR